VTIRDVGLDGIAGLHLVEGGRATPTVAGADLVTVLDGVDVPIVVLGLDLLLAWFNAAAANVIGLSPSDVGQSSGTVPPLSDVPRLGQRCGQAINSGVVSRIDFHDGERWFVVQVSPYAGSNEQVAGVVLTFTNVTAFRSSIDQAVYERECTKTILNTVAEPVVVLSDDQRIQSGNRAFYTMFGANRDETQGMPLVELPAFEFAPARAELETTLAGRIALQPVEVDRVLTPKGQRTLVLDARPLTFPGHPERRILVTFQDITLRKLAEAAKDIRSEEELRRSEAFLVEAQRLSSTGSFSWKVSTDEIDWSEQLYRIFEFEPATPVTIERINSRIHPEDLPMMQRTLERARVDGTDFQYSHRVLLPDGAVKYLNAIAHARTDAGGELEYIGAVQDVTHSRMSEAALARARSRLGNVARAATLGVLTASIAHEVNQPLAGIVTNAGTCLRMLDAEPPNLEGARETARRTIRDGNRASDVIKRLRALFSNDEFRLAQFDLNEATREVVALSLSDLHRNNVALQSDMAADLPAVVGDRIQLQQVILNLIRNASDAMIDVHDRPRQLVIRTEAEAGNRVRVSVRDAGVGVDPEDVNKLLDAFYTTKSDGMGIGLSVSSSIIEKHRGHLWVEPNDGPGATFLFSIPADPTGVVVDPVAMGHS
jgi:PAS domain S-box-containing protein